MSVNSASRDDAIPIAWDRFATIARTLRMEGTRQRCQSALCNTVSMVFSRPVWASDMTGLISRRPRVSSNRRRTGPEGLVVTVSDRENEHFPASVGRHADRDDDGL